MRDLEIYVHIPFCVKKCAYCDFLSAPAAEEEQDAYVQSLLAEIREGMPKCAGSFQRESAAADDAESGYRLWDDYVVTSVFIGGGTPSLLPAEQISEISDALHSRFRFAADPEVTIECNPGTVDAGKLAVYRACGINRLSFGLQSADNAELAHLGRIHTWETFLESYERARAAGFANINIDLMSALPGQTVSSWERTVKQVLALAPEHISAYSLIIEEGTPFYETYHEDDLRRAAGEQPRFLPSEEEERAMYTRTEELLQAAGLLRYEISNYARPGYACRHNIGYWRGTEYMGFGLGSSSLLGFRASALARPVRVRLKNPSTSADYEYPERMKTEGEKAGPVSRSCDEADTDYEILTRPDEMAEFMFLGLRMTDGISAQEFLRRFGCPVDQVYQETIRKFVSLGLLQQEGDRIFLTSRGLDVSNIVMAEFL